MKNKSQIYKILLCSITLTLFTLTPLAGQSAADKAYTCFPTCSEYDGRMMTLAGSGLFTLGGDFISMSLVISGSDTSFEVGIFDGDSGPPHWDRGTDELRYRLLADPNGDGSGTFLVGEWTSNANHSTQGPLWNSSVNGSPDGAMPDNDWFNITTNVSAEAQAAPGSDCPAGDYCYRLMVESTQPNGSTESNFKVRTTGQISLRPLAFSFVGAVRSFADLPIVYPRYPDFSDTTYDGSWVFVLQLDQPSSFFTVWDGDFDYGTHDCSQLDTVDADTCANLDSGCLTNSLDGVSFVPPWANGTAAFTEGVAQGNIMECGPTTGAPNDDQNPMLIPALPGVFTRSPAVYYELETPVGSFMNNNPSGNQEWEQFRLDTDLTEPADYHVAQIPAGEYRLRIFGLDAANLNALRISAVVKGMPSASLGDRVWLDRNGDGVQDPEEAGINGVEVRLYRDSDRDGVFDPGQDTLVAVQTTSGDGDYNFLGLGADQYWVDVVESTLPPGAVLTTANEPYLPSGAYALAEAEAHVDADFGYLLGSIGDLVWNDNNQDGVYQPNLGEVGIGGVVVELEGDVDGDGTVDILQTITDSDGLYLFPDLGLGDYIVRLTLDNFGTMGSLQNAIQSYDFDGLLDDMTSTNLPDTGGRNFWLADFGYYRECVPCLSKVGSLRMRYMGNLTDAHIRVQGTQGPQKGVVFFDDIVQPGEVYDILPVQGGNRNDLGVNLRFYINGIADADLHTSCSVEIGAGTVVGNSVIAEAWDKLGDLLCPAP